MVLGMRSSFGGEGRGMGDRSITVWPGGGEGRGEERREEEEEEEEEGMS